MGGFCCKGRTKNRLLSEPDSNEDRAHEIAMQHKETNVDLNKQLYSAGLLKVLRTEKDTLTDDYFCDLLAYTCSTGKERIKELTDKCKEERREAFKEED